MATLIELCSAAGFSQVQTYIASGNAVFRSDGSEAEVRASLDDQLYKYAGKPVGVLVRSAAEIAEVRARNPFADKPGNRVMVLFVESALPKDPLDGVTGMQEEQVRLASANFTCSTRTAWRRPACVFPARRPAPRET